MTSTQPTNIAIQAPTVDVSGKVVYKSGPWGSRYPARKATADIIVTDTTGATSFEGSGETDDNGKFRAKSSFIAFAFSQITLQIHEDFTGQDFDLTLYPGLIGPNQGPQDVGEIVFPFEPEHSELAWVNSSAFKDTQNFAKALIRILKSNDKRVAIDLLSEWRGTEQMPVEQLADDRFPRVTSVNGHVFKKPVPKGTQEERLRAKKEDERFIRERLKTFRPIPLLTPAQKLMKMLSMSGFAKDFPERVAKSLSLHGIASAKAGNATDMAISSLERFSLATMTELESGQLLRRAVTFLQKAGNERFHFDTVTEEAAADASAVCALIFLAGFMGKNNAEPKISFNYWHEFSLGAGVTETRPYVKISISAGK